MVVAFFLEGFPEDGHGEVGGVAVLAEVAEDDAAETGMGELGDEFGGLGVGEVAVAGADALFGGPGALGVGLKEGFVVVGLDEEAVNAAEALDHAAGDKADIAEEAEFRARPLEDEADGIDGVVLDRKGFDMNIADAEDLSGVEDFPRGSLDPGVLDDTGGGGGGVNWNWHLIQQYPEASNVVAVFVGEQDTIEGFRRNPQPPDAGNELLGAESGIDQQAHAFRLDHCRISRTPAAQHCESNHRADARKPRAAEQR